LPVTVAAHGFGASVAETRPLLSGVPGTKVFYEARGHGSAPAPGQVGYDELAGDLDAAAPDATQALGVSLGAHTVLRLLCRRPDRYAKAVLFLPAALDRPPVRREGLVDALEAGDRDAVLAWVQGELPPDRDTSSYAEARTSYLLSSPGLLTLLRELTEPPVPDLERLGAIETDVLVLAQESDPVHPAQVARDLAAALPRASLHVFREPGALWSSRKEFRQLVVGHLGEGS
ncbi:MAG: alpha/beta hydrolase fold protein, partial [Frankiales bacterium]|nr:alpha/beta hydrolase fold protein [Frankiales bacterium]